MTGTNYFEFLWNSLFVHICQRHLVDQILLLIFFLFFVLVSGFPGSSAGKESACNVGDPGSIPWLGRSTGEGIGYPLEYSWASLVTQLVKNPPAMWETWVWSWVEKIPWSMGTATTQVFWPGEFLGLYSPWGCKESDMTEQASCAFLCLLYNTKWISLRRWIISDVATVVKSFRASYQVSVRPPCQQQRTNIQFPSDEYV